MNKPSYHLYIPEWLISFKKDMAGEIILAQNYGEVIRNYRIRYDMSQSELGKLMELRRESISRIENGSVIPTMNFIKVFINAAALIEAVRVERVKNKKMDIYTLENISKELGFSREKFEFMLKQAIQSYDKKYMKIQQSLR